MRLLAHRRAITASAIILLAAATLGGFGAAAAIGSADVTPGTVQLCVGFDACSKAPYSGDDYTAVIASGRRYWGALPGVNCTNYAAYVEQTVFGVAPVGGLGNAGDWARNAAADGIPVNGTPAVGAVAEWNRGGVMGYDGHVAVVEAVGANFIDISQDNVSTGGADRFEWRRIMVGNTAGQPWPNNFIHFAVTVNPAVVVPEAQELSSTTNPFNGLQSVFVDSQDTLIARYQTASGWQTDAQLPDASVTGGISAMVDGSTGYSRVFYVDGTTLKQDYEDASGWHNLPVTAPPITGALSVASDPYTGYTDVFYNSNGVLEDYYSDAKGWHSAAIAATEVDGPISAVFDPTSGNLRVFYDSRGELEQVSNYANGWHESDLPVGAVTGDISAALDATTGDTSVAYDNGGLLELDLWNGSTWTNTALPANAVTGSISTALDPTSGYVTVSYDGNGTLEQLYDDATGWHAVVLPGRGVTGAIGSAVDPWSGYVTTYYDDVQEVDRSSRTANGWQNDDAWPYLAVSQ